MGRYYATRLTRFCLRQCDTPSFLCVVCVMFFGEPCSPSGTLKLPSCTWWAASFSELQSVPRLSSDNDNNTTTQYLDTPERRFPQIDLESTLRNFGLIWDWLYSDSMLMESDPFGCLTLTLFVWGFLGFAWNSSRIPPSIVVSRFPILCR